MLLIGAVAFIYFPAGTAHALPGGLLDGKPMYQEDAEHPGYTNAVTDNNPKTGINMYDYYLKRRLVYTFAEDMQITGYMLQAGSTNRMSLVFLDAQDRVIKSFYDSGITNYSRVDVKINKVRKVVISSVTQDGEVILEFDVWGIVPNTIPPAVPDLSGAMQGKSAVLSWDKSKEPDIDGFNVYRDGVKIAKLTNVQTYSVEQKIYGEKHTYTVTAFDIFGNESKPSRAVTLALDRPVTENTQEATTDYLLLKWQKTGDATGYRVYLNGRLIASVGANVFEYKITRAMGYIPGAISNRAEARAVLADGKEGRANNPVAPVIELGAGYSVLDALKAGLEFVKLLNGWVLIVLSIILANMIIAFIYMINKKYKTRGG